MSTKTKSAPNGASGANAPQTPPTYRVNPEVEAKIDAYIKDNPKHWAYVQGMPRDRLERTVALNEVRQIERQQRMREGLMQRINSNPKLKEAYETLVKDVPEDQREECHGPDGSPEAAHGCPLTVPTANQGRGGQRLIRAGAGLIL